MSDAPMHALDAPSPAGLSPEEKLVWILGDLMNAVENYFGCENPKRLGHINCAAIRIIDEVLNAAAPAPTVSGDAKEIVDRLRRASGDARRLCLDAAMMIEYLAGKKPHIHPAPTVSGEPVAWLRVRDDGRQTFWERNVDGACTPLYAHPAPIVSGDAREDEISPYEWLAQEFDRLAILRKMWTAHEVAAMIRRHDIERKPA